MLLQITDKESYRLVHPYSKLSILAFMKQGDLEETSNNVCIFGGEEVSYRGNGEDKEAGGMVQ